MSTTKPVLFGSGHTVVFCCVVVFCGGHAVVFCCVVVFGGWLSNVLGMTEVLGCVYPAVISGLGRVVDQIPVTDVC